MSTVNIVAPLRRVHLFVTFSLFSCLLALPSATASSFGSFVAQYTLPASFIPVAIAVGNSGTLYAVNTTTVLAFTSATTTQPTVVHTDVAIGIAFWMAAQPGTDILAIADNANGRFLLVDGAGGITPYADLPEYNLPQSCGFINNNRVVLVDQISGSTADEAHVTVITLGQAQAQGSGFTASWPSALSPQTGFTTDYSTGDIVFSFAVGVVVFSTAGATLNTFMATSDNSIAFLESAVASDAAAHLYLLQSTVIAQTNAQLIAVNVATGVLQADAQFGVVNGLSAAPLSVPVTAVTPAVPRGILAVDAQGQLYGINGGVVQVFSGLTAGLAIPAPLVSTNPGYYLYEITKDNNNPATPLSAPTSVAFDSAGNCYIADSAESRVVVQTSSGAFIRSLTGYQMPEEVRISGSLVYVSDTSTSQIFVQQTTGAAYATISNDDQGNALSNDNILSFDLDASGNVLIPLVINVDSTANAATIRISAVTNTGSPVPASSFNLGTVSGSDSVLVNYVVNDFIVDRVNNIAYIAYLTGSVMGYSLAISSLGAVVSTFASWGNANPFTLPYSLALDTGGRLYVADYCNNQGVIVLDAATGAYIDNFQGYYDSLADEKTNSVTIEPSTGHVFMTDDNLARVVIVQGFTAAAFSSSSSAAPAFASSSSSTGFSSGVSSSGGGHIVGDPQFIGFRGQSFQVHGIDGHVYSLISEPTLHMNALFVFLTSGRCPAVSGRPSENCWTHPGSYIGAISFQHRSEKDSTIHRLLITAGDAATGLAGVEVDGEKMTAAQMEAGEVKVVRLSAYEVRVSTPHFDFELINSDGFVNEVVRPLVSLKILAPHGLLGQTWQLRKVVVEGAVEDYSISHNELFGSDSMYDRFSQTALSSQQTESS